MVSGAELKELSDPHYWDTRYSSAQTDAAQDGEDGEAGTAPVLGSFEWYRSFAQIRPFLESQLPQPESECFVLHLGCGNSTLTADLHALGYRNQTSVDFSPVVIRAMSEKYKGLEGEEMKWEVMDVRDIKLGDGSVDVAIDKGTLDAMYHGSLWDPPEDVRENVGRYVTEVARVLKKGGQWLYITFRQPHFVKPLLEKPELWELEVKVLGDPSGGGGFEYFAYVMTRK